MAKLTGLYPKSLLHQAQVDEAIDGLDDVLLASKLTGKDQTSYDPGGAIYAAIGKVENHYRRLHHQGPFLMGTLTMADLVLFSYIGHASSGFFGPVCPRRLLSDFDLVRAARNAVAAHPKVQDYYDSESTKPYFAQVSDHYASLRGNVDVA